VADQVLGVVGGSLIVRHDQRSSEAEAQNEVEHIVVVEVDFSFFGDQEDGVDGPLVVERIGEVSVDNLSLLEHIGKAGDVDNIFRKSVHLRPNTVDYLCEKGTLPRTSVPAVEELINVFKLPFSADGKVVALDQIGLNFLEVALHLDAFKLSPDILLLLGAHHHDIRLGQDHASDVGLLRNVPLGNIVRIRLPVFVVFQDALD
jgi:hypothetical protein